MGEGDKCSEKCNIYIKYFSEIKCNADRPYLVLSELKPATHIYIFWPNEYLHQVVGDLKCLCCVFFF